MNNEVQQLKNQISDLEVTVEFLKAEMMRHFHDGNNSAKINLPDIFGLLDTTSSTPTIKPSGIYDQFKVASGSLYVYNPTTDSWINIAGATGVSGTFKSGDVVQKTITSTNGIITSIV